MFKHFDLNLSVVALGVYVGSLSYWKLNLGALYSTTLQFLFKFVGANTAFTQQRMRSDLVGKDVVHMPSLLVRSVPPNYPEKHKRVEGWRRAQDQYFVGDCR